MNGSRLHIRLDGRVFVAFLGNSSALQRLGRIVVLGGVRVLTRPAPAKLNQSAD